MASSLRRRLAELQAAAEAQAENQDRARRAAFRALLGELPDPVLDILAGRDLDFEARLDELMATDPEAARQFACAVLDLGADPELAALLVPYARGEEWGEE